MFISSFCSKSLLWVPVSYPSLLGPCTFSFISLCMSILLSFCDQTQSFLWAFWLSVFWTLHLICCLSPPWLVLFLEFWSVLSFGPYFFVSVHLICSNRQSLGIPQGRATHIAALWHCLGGGVREGTMPLAWLSPHFPSLPLLPASGLCPFRH